MIQHFVRSFGYALGWIAARGFVVALIVGGLLLLSWLGGR